MPAAAIDKIEVITNPSAKYRPDGTSGIINIVMKKNTDAGVNGSTTVNAGNQGRLNGSVRFNYRPDGLNVHGSYSVRKDNRNRINTDTRDQTDAASVLTHYRDYATAGAEPFSHSVIAGLDYEFDKQTSAGIAANYFRNDVDRNDNSTRVIENSSRVPISRYEHRHTADENEEEVGVEFSLDHQFGQEDHELKLQLSASREPESTDGRNVNFWLFPVQPEEHEHVVAIDTKTRKQAKLDYTLPLGEKSKLEAGYEGELGNNDIENIVERYDPPLQRYLTDTTVTNHFIYDENIHAVYATVRHSIGRFGVMGGLRLEQSFIDTRLIGLDSASSNNYSSYYPTMHLSYAVTEDAEVQMNYSRRVHRPEGDDLNPFPEYHDARNLSAGNPRLKPEYIHSVELGCKFQTEAFTILPSLYYRYTYNRFTSLTQRLNDSTLLTTRQNLSIDRSTGVEVVGSSSFGPFSANGSINGFLNEIDASNLGYGSAKSVWTWSAGLTMSYRFAHNSMMQVSSRFNSARLTPQGESMPSWSMNAGVRYEILEGKLSMTATVADLFKTQRRETRMDIPTLRQTVVNSRDAQVVYLGFTYYFGAPPKKQKEEEMKFEDSL